MELEGGPGWSAGPLHVHPGQIERITVLDGQVRWRVGSETGLAAAGGEIRVPPDTRHTVANAGDRNVRLQVHFEPRLRTAEMFAEMYGAGDAWRPSAWVPPGLRAFVESRGYGEEIRYL